MKTFQDIISDEKIIEICAEAIGEKYAKEWSTRTKKRLIDSVRLGISLLPRIRGVEKEILNLLTGFKVRI